MNLEFLTLLQGRYLDALISGATTTLSLFLLSLTIGFVLAMLLTALRATGIKALEFLVVCFVEYHRNVPALVQLMLWYFGLSQLFPIPIIDAINASNSEFFFGCVALSLNAAAYMSEDLRSGMRSIGHGQMEAARAVGLSYSQAMRDVILPQALRAALPPLTSQSLGLFKSTSLAMAIGVMDLTYVARQIESDTFRTFETFAIISIIYLVGSWTIAGLGFFWERRLRAAGAH